MMIARQRRLGVEVDSSPIPALRDDSGPAYANAAVPGAVGEKHAELGCDARSALVLQASGHHDVFEECAAHLQLR